MFKVKSRIRFIVALLVSINILVFTPISSLAVATPFYQTIEGSGNLLSLGTTFPSNITLAGYDSTNATKKVYVNFDLSTTGAAKTDYKYIIQVIDGSGTVLGSVGTYAAPIVHTLGSAATIDSFKNVEITLSSQLTADYRIVITVM